LKPQNIIKGKITTILARIIELIKTFQNFHLKISQEDSTTTTIIGPKRQRFKFKKEVTQEKLH